MMRVAAFLLIICFIGFPSSAQDTREQQNIRFAVDRASEICLSGTRYKMTLEGDGQLKILKLRPQGEAALRLDISRSTGGVNFNDERLREVVDDKTRTCIQNEWKAVSNVIRGNSQQTSSLIQLNFKSGWLKYKNRQFIQSENSFRDANKSLIDSERASLELDGQNLGFISHSGQKTFTQRVENGDHFLSVSPGSAQPGGVIGESLIGECSSKFFVGETSVFNVDLVLTSNVSENARVISCSVSRVN